MSLFDARKFALITSQWPWSPWPNRDHPRGVFTAMGSSHHPWQTSRWINKWATSAQMRIITSTASSSGWSTSDKWFHCWASLFFKTLKHGLLSLSMTQAPYTITGSGWSLDARLKLSLSKFWAVISLPTVLMLWRVLPASCKQSAKSFLIRVESLPGSRTVYVVTRFLWLWIWTGSTCNRTFCWGWTQTWCYSG